MCQDSLAYFDEVIMRHFEGFQHQVLVGRCICNEDQAVDAGVPCEVADVALRACK